MQDVKAKTGPKPKIVANANDTFEALGIAGRLDGTIQDVVSNPDKHPKLFERIVALRLQHGVQKDPMEKFSSLGFDEMANKVTRLGVTLHPDYRTLEGISDHIWRGKVPCPLMIEGTEQLKKKEPAGN